MEVHHQGMSIDIPTVYNFVILIIKKKTLQVEIASRALILTTLAKCMYG